MTRYNPVILETSYTKPNANSAFRPLPFVRGSGLSFSTIGQFKDSSSAGGLDYNSPSPRLRIPVENIISDLTALWPTQLEGAAWVFRVDCVATCDSYWNSLGCDAMWLYAIAPYQGIRGKTHDWMLVFSTLFRCFCPALCQQADISLKLSLNLAQQLWSYLWLAGAGPEPGCMFSCRVCYQLESLRLQALN